MRFGRRQPPAEDEVEAERRQARVKGIFEDLLNLEINVIVTPGMTARKMPDPGEALGDIAKSYKDLLVDFSLDVRKALTGSRDPRVKVMEPAEARASIEALGELTMVDEEGMLVKPESARKLFAPGEQVSLREFRVLEARAQEGWAVACALVAGPAAADENLNERVVLLKRISRNCDELAKLLEKVSGSGSGRTAVGDLELTAQQLITLRKIWELGIATVAMQTVVQLDGDIVTRIHSGHVTRSSGTIHELHREAVGSAMQNWQYLGQTLAQFVSSVLKNLL